jgi:hypothetical protein
LVIKKKYIEETVNTEFLGLQIDNRLNWKNHVDQLVPKLSGACYAVRSVSHISSIETLRSLHFSHFHSVMKYGIIFWGNSHVYRKTFTLQKKIFRFVASVKTRNSCRSLFKRLEISSLPREYVCSLINFIVNNQGYFQSKSAVHRVNTRNRHHLYIPAANLSCFQKNACYWGSRISSSLPCSLKRLVNKKTRFKAALKGHLDTRSFYSVE